MGGIELNLLRILMAALGTCLCMALYSVASADQRGCEDLQKQAKGLMMRYDAHSWRTHHLVCAKQSTTDLRKTLSVANQIAHDVRTGHSMVRQCDADKLLMMIDSAREGLKVIIDYCESSQRP